MESENLCLVGPLQDMTSLHSTNLSSTEQWT